MKEETQPPQMGEPVPRSIRITEELLQQFDYTKGCPKCGKLRRGEKSGTVHHSKLCRSRIEDEIKKEDVLSKKFAGVEERKTQFLARKVQESDQRRVEERDAEEQAEHLDPIAATSFRSVSSVGVLERERNAELNDNICSWIECATVQRTWAELTEDQSRDSPHSGGPLKYSERTDSTIENHKIPAGFTSLRCVGPAGSPTPSSSPSVERTCGGEPTAEDKELEKRAMGTDELRKKPMGLTSPERGPGWQDDSRGPGRVNTLPEEAGREDGSQTL